MARSIGDLGTPREPVDLTFNYFGLVIKVNPSASDLDLVGFMLEAADVETVDENKAMQATARYLKGLVADDDWDTFWSAAKANRQTLPDLLLLGEKIVEAVSGTPFESPSASAAGPPTTNSKSKAASPSPARARQRGKRGQSQGQDVQRALELVPGGRADIKEFLIQAQEARGTSQTDVGETTASRMGLTAG
jgi:hypothetical protein